MIGQGWRRQCCRSKYRKCLMNANTSKWSCSNCAGRNLRVLFPGKLASRPACYYSGDHERWEGRTADLRLWSCPPPLYYRWPVKQSIERHRLRRWGWAVNEFLAIVKSTSSTLFSSNEWSSSKSEKRWLSIIQGIIGLSLLFFLVVLLRFRSFQSPTFQNMASQ